jgi:hypothetical protein
METDATAVPPEVAEKMYVPVELEPRFTVSAVVAGLPNASCSWTVIGPRLAVCVAVPDTGLDVKANCEAGPELSAKVALTPVERPLAVALREKVPGKAEVRWQPAKVATPLEAVTGLVEHATFPLPELIPSVTDAALPVTVFPPASSTVTTGWGDNVRPKLPLLGEDVNTSWAAAPAVRVKGPVVAAGSVPSVTVRV